jgi:hypothetical protein
MVGAAADPAEIERVGDLAICAVIRAAVDHAVSHSGKRGEAELLVDPVDEEGGRGLRIEVAQFGTLGLRAGGIVDREGGGRDSDPLDVSAEHPQKRGPTAEGGELYAGRACVDHQQRR